MTKGTADAGVVGRRRPDTLIGDLPDDIQAGDYWKVTDRNGDPLCVDHSTNLTGHIWMVAAPMPSGSFGIGRLEHHTVREHEDGTITVAAGDGSSNSILIRGAGGQEYHGWISQGVWS